MNVVWKLREPKIQFHDTDFITDKILKIRGIEDTYAFLNPNMLSLNNHCLLKNTNVAANKVINHIFNGKKIGIYADIDTDGVMSTVVAYKYLKNFTDNIVMLYHQRVDGHGVKVQSCIDHALDMVIVVDSSTNLVKECQELQQRGVEVVILDHHIAETDNPYATIVNPHTCDYPNKDLSGVGVVFQFCRAIDDVMNTDYAFQYIEFVAIGLIGDMMDVTQPETRYLIHEGLMKIRSQERDEAIDIALKELNSWYMPTATDLAFSIIPMINSAIRLGHIEWTLELFTTTDTMRCKELVKQCVALNKKRKKKQKAFIEQLRIDDSNNLIIINATENNIDVAMRGLIANDIANTYQKPCLVVSEENGVLSGSGRSFGDIVGFKDLLAETGLFMSLEGHQAAFGVEFKQDNLVDIYNAMNETLADTGKEIVINADMEINAHDINWSFVYDLLPLYLICGNGFEEPKFIINNIDYHEHKTMGEFKNHLKLVNDTYEIVQFNVTQQSINKAVQRQYQKAIGTLGINTWYNFGKRELVHTIQVMADNLM